MWNGVVTNVGLNLLEQWASGGDVLPIEKATVGSGLVAQTNLRSSTYVQGEVGNAPIVASTPVTGGTQYRVQIQPAQNAAYVLHQVGIWAHLGNNGASTLIALYQEEDGISVPLQADQPGFLFTMYAIVTMSNTGEMTVNFDTSAYMTRSDFDAAMENYVTVTTFNTAIAGMVKGVNNGTSTETPDENGVVTLPTDNTPTEDSDNYVKSGGVYNALEEKQDTLTFDSSPTQDSTNPVTSGGVYAANAAQDTQIAALQNDLGIVEDGDTATHTIAQGQYVIWQGALYTADAAIASGTTLAASGGNKNLTAVENGGLNALNSKIATKQNSLDLGITATDLNNVDTGCCVTDSNTANIPNGAGRCVVSTTKTIVNGYVFSIQIAVSHDQAKQYLRYEWGSWGNWHEI